MNEWIILIFFNDNLQLPSLCQSHWITEPTTFLTTYMITKIEVNLHPFSVVVIRGSSFFGILQVPHSHN